MKQKAINLTPVTLVKYGRNNYFPAETNTDPTTTMMTVTITGIFFPDFVKKK